MELRALTIGGAYELLGAPHRDERGFFARVFDADVARSHGLRAAFEQQSVAYNARRGTLRGLHYQAGPSWETKLVLCLAGCAFDVVLDLRRDSPTFGRWEAVELDASRCNAVYVPEGCAHGYQTLDDNALLLYEISPPYRAELARGIDPLDPALRIPWPVAEAIMSERDRALPPLRGLP